MAAHGSLSCEPAADDSFGPAVALCARSFDFTLLFEQSTLSVAPSITFLLLSPWRLLDLRVSSQKTRHSWISIAKPSLALSLILSQLSLLVLYIRPSTTKTRVSIPATVLALAAAMTIVPLSYHEQNRSVRPSTLLSSYLALSIILDIPQARTLYLIPRQLDLAVTFSVSIAVKFGLLLLEAWSKRALLEERYRALAIETTSGIFSRSLFLWMNGLFVQAFSKVISPDDLGPVDRKLASAALHGRLHDEWIRQDRHVKWPLFRAMWRALRWSILSPVPPRLCYGGFLFAQPFLINRAIAYLSRPSGVFEDDVGYGLIVAAGCIYLGIAFSTALYKHQLYRHIKIVRGSLVSVIYSHSLFMEGRVDDPSAAVTLMSTDVDRICQSISLLALQIGWISVMPLVVVTISALIDSRVTLLIAGRVKTWTDAVQRRISLTADTLSLIKSVKIPGLTRPLHTLLQNERLRELRLQAKFRWSTVWLNTLGNVPPALTPVVTFIAYAIKARVEGSSSLNTSQAFPSLALISLVTTPATELLGAFPATASC